MDNIRLFLWVAVLASVWLSYTAWVADNAPPAVETAPPTSTPSESPEPGQELPQLVETDAPPTVVPRVAATPAAPLQGVRVRTDVLDVLIDTNGADLVRAELPLYPVDKARPDEPVRLLDYAADNRWVFQTGLRNAVEGPEPNHLARFESANASYELAENETELIVSFVWAEQGPIAARKTFTFRRGEYNVDLEIVLENRSDEVWRGAGYAQMVRLHRPVERSFMSVDSYSFTGPVFYDGEQYEKLEFEDLAEETLVQSLPNGWFAGIQHHFLAAAVPPPEETVRYQAATRGGEYVLSAISPVQEVQPGGELRYPIRLFVGPKLQDQLSTTGEGLELTVDYGVLTVLAQPLFWLLSKVHDAVGNWGWTIIFVTFLIKLAFYKLTAASGRSMAKMRTLAPRMKTLQERYKDDRQALSQAMMDLYKREKVNPAAGCLPILIQMPFFFAFYWVLIESVEMRQAPFMLWINDLSVRDPFFVLPLLMGAAMFFQMRLNPAPPDPVQAKIMQIMPLMFTGFMAFFPAGLVLYWLTNTGLSILQQWRINTVVARDSPSKTA